ncbi:flagellar basal body-associated FliL family protein [Amorphus sp. MBR-141]
MAQEPEEAADGGASPKKKKGGTLIAIIVLTLLAIGAGGGIGMKLASTVEEAVTSREVDEPAVPTSEMRYSGDMVLLRLAPVIANLAAPSDTWIRIETAIVFPNGSLANPDVAASQIGQDIVAYARTLSLSQLQGPTALQYLRDDLNERAALRTDGKVSELIIETMVVQ